MDKIIHGNHSINDDTAGYTECVFNDYSSFYRSFVKYINMTPEEFKRLQGRTG